MISLVKATFEPKTGSIIKTGLVWDDASALDDAYIKYHERIQ